MEVIATGPAEVKITGDIKSIADYLEIKKVMSELLDNGARVVSVKIPNSPFINSALLGYFLRLIHEEKITLSLQVGNDKLFNMLTVMNLITIFNVSGAEGGRI